MTPNLTPIRELQVCAKHPNVEASLRCIRCDRLMCTQCIVRTPVGYICKECSRRQEDKFFDAATQDYVLQGVTCFVTMAVMAAVLTQIPFASGFFGLFLGPIVGGLAGEAALRVTGRRRGRYTDVIGTAAVGLGGLAGHMAVLASLYQQVMDQIGPEMQELYVETQGTLLNRIFTGTVLDIWFLIFLGLACGGAYTRLRGRI